MDSAQPEQVIEPSAEECDNSNDDRDHLVGSDASPENILSGKKAEIRAAVAKEKINDIPRKIILEGVKETLIETY